MNTTKGKFLVDEKGNPYWSGDGSTSASAPSRQDVLS
jgi:hypothetical protein